MDRLASAGTQPNLEEVMDRITDAIFALDNDWRFTFVTLQAGRLLQHSAASLLGRVVWDVFPDTVGTQFQIQYERAVREQVAVGFREYFQPCETWFDVRAYPSSTGLSIFFVDVGDTVGVETELCRSEQRFRATFDRAPVGIAHVAPNSRWLRVNDRLVEILGYSRDELAKMTFQDVTYPDDRAAEEAQAKAVLAGEIDSYTMEKRYVRKDGRVVWTELTVSLVRDERGEPAYFVSVVHDIEDRKRVEQQLHNALDERTALAAELDDERVVLRALMANTDAHLAYLDPELRFIAVNATYAAGSGHAAYELIGRNHFEVFPSEENQRIFEQARDDRKAVVFRAKPFEFPDQPWRGVTYWDWRLTPVVDSGGAVQGLVLSLVNVTESVKRRRFSEALNHLNGVIHSTLDFDRIVSEVVDQLAEAIGSEIAGVALRSGDSTWRVVDVYGLPVSVGSGALLDESQFPAEPSSGLATAPFVAGEAAGRPFTHGLLAELGVRSLLVAPLTAPAEEPGVIAFGYRSGPGTFDDIQIDFAAKVAASLSLALNNSRLFEAESRAARMAASLASINEVLLSTLAIEDIIDRVVLETCRAVGADRSIMAEMIGPDMVVSHVTGFAKERMGQMVPLEALPAIRDAMETREPQLVSDTDVDPRASKEVGRELGYRAFMALPLVAGEHANAVLSYTYDHPRNFDEHDREFAKRLSVALSLALENARHFKAERTIADRLQEALLAIPDSIEGVEFAHAYYSATEAARVGGDFYDIFELNHNHVGITIGDVAGKGLDAAVLTSLVKNTIRAHATEKGKTPSDVLALTNEVLFKATGLETFVTVFFGILDCRDGRLVYANGGHTTAVLVTEEGTTLRLPVTGPILGAFEEAGFDQAEVRLDFSELLFLYTDGLTEARRGKELYGEQRLFDFLGATRNGSPGTTAQRVLDDVVEWTGGHLRDDLAVLSLSRAEYTATTPTQQKLEL